MLLVVKQKVMLFKGKSDVGSLLLILKEVFYCVASW